ncbi:MAG: O-antigen ligase family protein [Pyrinomonadaceae bacterium]
MSFAAAIDEYAGIGPGPRLPQMLERAAFVALLLMIAAAPHSIAATQAAWLFGMLMWVIRCFIQPRPEFLITPLGYALFGLFAWTAVSAFFSYEPLVSLDKLRGTAVFLIFLFAINTLRNRRAVHLAAALLVGSCMVSVLWLPVQKLLGRGIQIHEIAADGPLAGLGVLDGDVIVRANKKLIRSPSVLAEELMKGDPVTIEFNRLDAVYVRSLSRSDVDRTQGTAEQMLGFGSWNAWRGFRAAGFYGHFTTYAEVLQLIGALAVGLLVAGVMLGATLRLKGLLAVSVLGISAALLLTVTRASQLSFVIASAVIVLLGASRKMILFSAAAAVPIALIGLYVLQQQRQVSFFDKNDGSIKYRQMMWRDGLRLMNEEPRHLIVGVGMDSIKTHWEEWGLYDKGHQPMGHFHSTPIQLVVERGIPALLIWLIVLGIYARTLWQARSFPGNRDDWRSRGIILGCAGGLAGFFASGLVHYNLGDQEVAMVFYIIMAFGTRLAILPAAEDLLKLDSPILANA